MTAATDVTSSPCSMTVGNNGCNTTMTPHPEILLVAADSLQIACNGQPFAAGAKVIAGGGHPKVYYTFDGRDAVVCGYCDRLFTKVAQDGAVPYSKR